MQETQGMWVWSLYWEDLLEEKMAPHSIILAWKKKKKKISQTEEPGRLQSNRLPRVGHERATEHVFVVVQSCPTLCNAIGCSTRGFTISRSSLRLVSSESVMPSDHLILCWHYQSAGLLLILQWAPVLLILSHKNVPLRQARQEWKNNHKVSVHSSNKLLFKILGVCTVCWFYYYLHICSFNVPEN